MNDLEYKTTVEVLKTTYGAGDFKNLMENGVNQAKEIIIKALTEKPSGLSYPELNSHVKEFLSSERWEGAAWKTDAFVVAIAGLELEDRKIRHELGIYTLLN
jgi:hypothetical protein